MSTHCDVVEKLLSSMILDRQETISEGKRQLFYIKMMKLYGLKSIRPFYPKKSINSDDIGLFNTNQKEFYDIHKTNSKIRTNTELEAEIKVKEAEATRIRRREITQQNIKKVHITNRLRWQRIREEKQRKKDNWYSLELERLKRLHCVKRQRSITQVHSKKRKRVRFANT
jgi:hypothetical protein